jgi:integrase/recombinase XerD
MTGNNRKISLKTNGKTTLRMALKIYQDYGTIMQLSPHSIKHREYCLNIFIEVMGDMDCSKVNIDTYNQYLVFLNKKYENVTTIRTQLQVLKAFLNFCFEKEYIKKFKMMMPKEEDVIKRTYTDVDLKKLLEKPKRNSFNQWKSWAMANFLLGTGCRVRTAINMQIQDIDFGNNLITFTHTKNKKQQIIPLSKSLSLVLKEYLSLWEYQQDDYLFPNYKGVQMTADAFKRNVQRYNNSRGVDITSSHAYRHTFAKRWILNGGDIFRLQKILGHSNLDMVKKYVNIYGNELQIGFESFNALDSLKGINKITLK